MGVIIAVAVVCTIIVCLLIVILKSFIAPQKAEAVRTLIKKGRYDQAIKLAKSILVKNPKNFLVHYYLGRALIIAKKYNEALSEYDTVNDNALFDPPLNEITFRKEFAELLVRVGKKESAIRELMLLTQLDGGQSMHYFNLGKLEAEVGKKDDALKHLVLCSKMDTKNAKVHAVLGDIYFQMKKTKDAKYELDAAIKLNPNEYSCYYYLGKVLKEEKNIAEAVKAFDKAQRDNEYKQRALIERGTCYIAVGRLDTAAIDLQRAIEVDKEGFKSETVYARYFLAGCYEKDRQIDKAIEQWKAIAQKNKGFKDVAAKLEKYEGLAANDNMKDFLTCTDNEFVEMCKNKCLKAMKLACQQAKVAKDGSVLIAVEAGEGDWRSARKQVQYLRFFRGVEPLDEVMVRDVLDAAKAANCHKSIILSSAGFTKTAIKAAEGRPVELFGKEKLEKLLA